MKLTSDTRNFASWYLEGIRVMVKASPKEVCFTIIAMVSSRVASVFALLLPLKVVILAGSDGIPRYFEFLISEGSKSLWIMYLASAAIVLYVLKVVLDSVSEKLLSKLSATLVGGAARLNIFNDQEEKAKRHFTQFCRVAAYGLFFLSGLLLLSLIQPALFLFILFSIPCAFMATSFVYQIGSSGKLTGKLKDYIEKNFREYINNVSSFLFLLSFMLILYPYLMPGREANLIASLLSLLLVRQMFIVGGIGLSSSVVVSRNIRSVSSLLFADKVYGEKNNKEEEGLRDCFSLDGRDSLIKGFFEKNSSITPCIKEEFLSGWMDPFLVGVYHFPFSFRCGSGSLFQGELTVFSPKKSHYFKNESLLFEFLDRSAIMASPMLGYFSHHSFQCQIIKTGQPVKSFSQFKELELNIVENLWSISPASSLVEIYSSSHSFFYDKLDEAIVKGELEASLVSAEEYDSYIWFSSNYSSIKSILKKLPLCLVNPDINTKTVFLYGGRGAVSTWVRWGIEPFGANIPTEYKEEDVDALVKVLSERRPEFKSAGFSSLILSWMCWNLYQEISKRKYGKAKEHLRRIRVVFNNEGGKW